MKKIVLIIAGLLLMLVIGCGEVKTPDYIDFERYQNQKVEVFFDEYRLKESDFEIGKNGPGSYVSKDVLTCGKITGKWSIVCDEEDRIQFIETIIPLENAKEEFHKAIEWREYFGAMEGSVYYYDVTTIQMEPNHHIKMFESYEEFATAKEESNPDEEMWGTGGIWNTPNGVQTELVYNVVRESNQGRIVIRYMGSQSIYAVPFNIED